MLNGAGERMALGFVLVYDEHAGNSHFQTFVSLLQLLVTPQIHFSAILVFCLPLESHQVREHMARLAHQDRLSIMGFGRWEHGQCRLCDLLRTLCIFNSQANSLVSKQYTYSDKHSEMEVLKYFLNIKCQHLTVIVA